MTTLTQKIKIALDESRMLILGAQVLLGFQFRAMLERGFAALPQSSQWIKIIALGVLLISIALIMLPSAYHRVVWRGDDSNDVHNFTTTTMDIALLPFALATSLEFYVMSRKVVGLSGGIAIGTFIGICALGSWYGLGALSRSLEWDPVAQGRLQEDAEVSKTEIVAKVEHVLTETRVVLPGVQALLGFQLATMLLDTFDKLPRTSRYCHLFGLLLMGVTVIFLMTPAAYHRIVERGEATDHFHRLASNLLLAAMFTLPLGICAEMFVTVRHVTDSVSFALVSSLVFLLFFYGLWFGFTVYRRNKRIRGARKVH